MSERNERGIALIVAMLVMMLMSALLVGFTSVVMGDQRFRFIDRDRNRAFYGASAGVEKMTTDLGNLFLANVAPTQAQLTTLTNAAPSISLVQFSAATGATTIPTSSLAACGGTNSVRSVGTAGYTIRYCGAPDGRPTLTGVPAPVKSGPYEGLIAQQMPFQLDVTARTTTGGEVHLVRAMEAVAIPVFQFGLFSDNDLSFFAGPNFNFGGRVHTNGNLFLAEGDGSTLTLSEKVTAVKEIVRQRMQNGVSIDTGPSPHRGTVNVAKAPGGTADTFRALARTEGSVTDGPTSTVTSNWETLSKGDYNLWIRNGKTGAKALNLALITAGGTNPDLIRRPPPGEDATKPVLLSERLFTKASLRILLSDTAADITGLPTVTGGAPVLLDGNWRTSPPTGYAVDATHPPIARAGRYLTTATVNGSVANGATTFSINSGVSPAGFFNEVIPALTVTKSGNSWNVVCTGRTTAKFTNCTPQTAHTSNTTATGATVTGIITTSEGTTIAVAAQALTGTWNSGSNVDLPVGTTPFFPVPVRVWINSSAGNEMAIACTGPNSDGALSGCSGITGAIASNTAIKSLWVTQQDVSTVGGYLKIERGNADGSWTDVTTEILNYGISDAGAGCNPTPNAIVRLQRVGEYPYSCTSNLSTDYWPNTLFDTREALARDTSPGSNPLLGGVMHYITIDAANLSKWFLAAAPYAGGTGASSRTDNGGYTLYFSDRRNNRNASNAETGDYGYEDFVNPAASDGAPNGALDTGEDSDGDNALDTYGATPNNGGTYNTSISAAPLTTAATPRSAILSRVARVNRAILFRRALKLVNGADLRSLGITGLSIVSENPVYVQGNWNATGGNFNGQHAATAVMADAVTLLSGGWTDSNSFANPYTITSRSRSAETWYRLAIIAGKAIPFPQPSGTASDFGTDGGAHNLLRYLEDGNQAVNYRGSIATFFNNRQAVGTFKCCTTVYQAPTRNYSFDTDFLNPALLPPNTPMFRDLNAVGFAQELRPGR